jgi:hypothetical protein
VEWLGLLQSRQRLVAITQPVQNVTATNLKDVMIEHCRVELSHEYRVADQADIDLELLSQVLWLVTILPEQMLEAGSLQRLHDRFLY